VYRNQEYFELSFQRYLDFYEQSIRDPAMYASNLKNLSLNQSMVFFMINSVGWLILSSLIRTFFLQKPDLFFAVLSETLVLLVPIFILILFFSCLLHLLSKVLGSRTRLSNNLKAVFFSTILFPFFAVPVFKTVAALISLFILIYCFKTVNRFDRLKAVLSVTIPVFLIFLALLATGILNPNLVTR
jgi:hypothetical protein